MSALTDLFTSMANKIRSKTGTATTYTPPQMVSNGIDDVFDAGVASATTSITPSNASPVSMAANTGYKPTAAGYAISSYNSVTPSNSSPVALTSGDIDKMGGAGYAIQSYSSITPSNSSPVDLASGSIYKISRLGKAVASVTTLTPSDSLPDIISSGTVYKASANGKAVSAVNTLTPSNSSPATISSGTVYKASAAGKAVESITDITPTSVDIIDVSSGDIVKFGGTGKVVRYITNITPTLEGVGVVAGSIYSMVYNGYVYSERPTVTETTLWTNSSPTSNFSGQNISLSDDIDNYDWLKIKYRWSTSDSTESSTIVEVSEFKKSSSSNDTLRPWNIGGRFGSTGYLRMPYYVSDTQINIPNCCPYNTNSTNNGRVIPTKVIGIKLPS